MRKAELLKMRMLKVTPTMKTLAKEDVGEDKKLTYGCMTYGKTRETCRVYQYYKYYRAEVENKILKIAIFTRKNIADGKNEPAFTIFIDNQKEEWITYENESGRWLTGMISNLPFEHERGEEFGDYGWHNRKETVVVNEYLGEIGHPKKAVREYQTKKKQDIIQKRHRSEIEQIDEFMQTVPELPKGFDNWIVRSAYKSDTYLIMKPGKVKEAYCTRCQKMVPVKQKKKHNDIGKCPCCKSSAIYKSFGKQKSLSNSKYVTILQKTKDNDGYVLRTFTTHLGMKRETEYKQKDVYVEEKFRFRLDENFEVRETYEYGEYRYTGVYRWCHELNHGGFGWYSEGATTYGSYYELNLESILKDTDAKYVPIKKFASATEWKPLNLEIALEIILKHPEIEKLMKVGLIKIVYQILKNGHEDKILWNCEKLEDMLHVNKEYMRLAISMNADLYELEIIQAAYRSKTKITQKQVDLISKFYPHSSRDDLQIILQRGNLEKMLNYLQKLQLERRQEGWHIGRDYEDYLEQLGRLHMPMDKHNRFPANFYQTHERLSELIREKDNNLKKASIQKKERELRKIVRVLKKLYYAESDEYEIVWPMSNEDFQKEGQQQHNCVGGYFNRVIEEKTVVFFLRKKEEKDTPFCTVEFTNGKLIQCRTQYNGQAPQEVHDLMEKIEKNYIKKLKEIDKEKNIA